MSYALPQPPTVQWYAENEECKRGGARQHADIYNVPAEQAVQPKGEEERHKKQGNPHEEREPEKGKQPALRPARGEEVEKW